MSDKCVSLSLSLSLCMRGYLGCDLPLLHPSPNHHQTQDATGPCASTIPFITLIKLTLTIYKLSPRHLRSQWTSRTPRLPPPRPLVLHHSSPAKAPPHIRPLHQSYPADSQITIHGFVVRSLSDSYQIQAPTSAASEWFRSLPSPSLESSIAAWCRS